MTWFAPRNDAGEVLWKEIITGPLRIGPNETWAVCLTQDVFGAANVRPGCWVEPGELYVQGIPIEDLKAGLDLLSERGVRIYLGNYRVQSTDVTEARHPGVGAWTA